MLPKNPVRDNSAPETVDQTFAIGTLVALGLVLVYSYWNSLELAAANWSAGQYSHGWLVPLLALGLLWFRWKPIGVVTAQERYIGAAVIGAALLFRVLSAMFRYNTPDMYSFVPAMLGVFMLVGGWGLLRWSWGPVAFLIFMFPLPMEAEQRLLHPLQSWASLSSNYVLETLGIETLREGNTITITGVTMPLNVAEACSGLRMLTIFFALSLFLAMIMQGQWWEKVVIVVSTVPIALAVNITRIVITGLLYMAAESSTLVTQELAQEFFHNMAGWFMMPMALGLMYVEMLVMGRLMIEQETVAMPVALRPSRTRIRTVVGD